MLSLISCMNKLDDVYPFLILIVAFTECRLSEYASIAYVTFEDTYALENAILLSVSFCFTPLLG